MPLTYEFFLFLLFFFLNKKNKKRRKASWWVFGCAIWTEATESELIEILIRDRLQILLKLWVLKFLNIRPRKERRKSSRLDSKVNQLRTERESLGLKSLQANSLKAIQKQSMRVFTRNYDQRLIAKRLDRIASQQISIHQSIKLNRSTSQKSKTGPYRFTECLRLSMANELLGILPYSFKL